VKAEVSWIPSCTRNRHDGFLKDALEGEMTGKPARGRKRLNTVIELKKESTWNVRRFEDRKEW